MGWLCSDNWTKQDIILRVTSPSYWGKNATVMDYAVVGPTVYIALELDTDMGGRIQLIAVVLTMGPDAGATGYSYKTIDETMGPAQVDCPKRLLKLVPDPKVSFSTSWREKVHAYHAWRASTAQQMRRLTVGDRIYLKPGCSPSSLIYQGRAGVRSAKGHLAYSDDGVRYRIYPRYIDFERTFADR